MPPRPLGAPLRVVGGQLDVVALDQIGGLQLVYSPRSNKPPVAILLTPRQAADLAARLSDWEAPESPDVLATPCPKCGHALGRHTPSHHCATCLTPCDGFLGVEL